MNLAIDRVVSCMSEISCWMEQNDLRLNPDKTDILLIHSRFREGPALDYLQFMDERISISDKVRSLGVSFDKHMTFDDQIDHVCKSSINHLRNLFRIRTYLDVNAASKVIQAIITTLFDYCNHLYADDTQLYLAFKTNHINLAIDRVVSCVSEITYWMEQNDLRLTRRRRTFY